MIIDKDLEFLKDIDGKYLETLVDVMINYDGGSNKLKEVKKECEKYGASYQSYLDVIIDEYLRYGNDAFNNVLSDIKISYRHVLSDVCSSFKIDFDSNKTVEENEQLILEKALIEIVNDLPVDNIVDFIVSVYAKPKRSHLTDWVKMIKDEFRIIRCVAPNPLSEFVKYYFAPIGALIMDLYQKGKPELQVMIPCTLLIAVYRRM